MQDMKQKLQSLCALGAETELATPHIELRADRQAVIEGCAGILEYDETLVRLNCRTCLLELTGCNLRLEHLSGELVCVSGTLAGLSFSSV